MIAFLLTDAQVNSICGALVAVAFIWMIAKIIGD